MFIAYRHAERRIFAALAEAGYDDITLAQGRLAARIDEHGSRLTTLAESAQVTKQTAQHLVDQLEAAGYVERTPDPTDARARLVRLADRGRGVQAAARREEERILQEWTDHLGVRRMKALREALARLREITDPYL
ncbi:MAG: MarR family transcriptional regulator [Nocardioides sp.]|nr:MarR family transcriptional regulator [Nocardioides sp.]